MSPVCQSEERPLEHQGEFGYGEVWTWVAVCADTKLVPTWLVGERTTEDGTIFMQDLASRLDERVQLTTDGLSIYPLAVESAFFGENCVRSGG